MSRSIHIPRRHMVTAAVSAGALSLLAAGIAPTASATSATSADDDHGRGGFVQVNLVSDQAGQARLTDPKLVNPWGLSQGPTTPLWVSDNGSDVSTLYQGAGRGQTPARLPLVVAVPGGAPTGQVFNDTTGFVLPDGAPARFVFAGEHGTISAWNPQTVPATSAVRVAASSGAVYKGIALVHGRDGARLLLADFHNNRIDVLDASFHYLLPARRAFTDPHLPAGYAPFNVAVAGDRVLVAYARQDADRQDDVAGAGAGILDEYSTQGRWLRRLVTGGPLNSPWGLAVAPEGFGKLGGDLLVGNFGDGRIHAVDLGSGRVEATLRDSHGKPVQIDGLWALLPGNGTSAGSSDLWFSAGPGHEEHGLLGVLRAVHH